MRRPAWLAALLLAAWPLHAAWAVYRIVGPDGQVTFTDVPPVGGARALAPLSTPAGSPLSPALREAMRNAPVVVYTMAHCPACRDGVALLRRRGVPYRETTIDDAAAAQRFEQISHGVRRLPLLTVGTRQLDPGFNAAVWNDALDAAGYPAVSQLPPGWTFAPPVPLRPPQPAAASAPARAGSVPVRPPPNPHAPPGFQF